MTALLSRLGVAASLFLSLFLTTSPARGQEIDQTVARLSFVSGAVSYSRGDDPDEWDPAIVNVPFTLGDRIYAPEDGRAELQLPAGNFVRLAPRSYFSALNLTYDTKQFYLGEGSASFNIRNLASDETFEVATPNMAVTFDSPGKYRIEVDEDGNSRVQVRRGRVIVAANGRQINVEEGELRVYGIDSPRYEIVALRGSDAFDRWVDERDSRFDQGYASTRDYVSDQLIGVEDLREYGRWEQIPEYGYAWTPDRVPAGWQPYTVGHWFWQDPWGWTWVSREPWGWAPSHYGRWTNHRSRWYWVPVRQRVRVVRYEPACVEFVRVRDRVGWFPLHPRDRSIPYWRRRVESQNVTYVNRQHVTVVNQNIFVSGRNVTNNILRDSVIVREASSARMMEHSLPVPTRASLRFREDREREGQRSRRPADKILSRPAVVRVAPAPPPPTFQEKLPEIEKRRGEPVSPDKALNMGLKNLKTPNRRNPIRPASVESSRTDFAPRNPSASAPASQPVTPTRGKKLATAEEPVLTNLSQRPDRSQKSEAQTEQTRPAPAQPIQRRDTPPEPQQSKQEQERELQKRERQAQEQKREEQQQLRNEEQRAAQKRQELERQQQEQKRQQQQTQVQEQKREEQQQLRQERLGEEQKRQEVERQRVEGQERQKDKRLREQKEQQARKQQQLEEQKRQELQRQQQERQSQQQQREEQKRQELARQRQPEQERQKQLQEHQQVRKEQQQQQLRAAQQREEQKRRELERQQQEKQQQSKAQQLRKEQKRPELESKVLQKPGIVTP
jgi:hypothetical protein